MPKPSVQVKNSRSLEGDFIWKTVDQFFQTYWSGLDARIYANNVLLDEIISLQWMIQEPVMPLFGYHSYTFESVVRGARRVQGTFTINYKRESYIFDLLNTLSSNQQLSQPIIKSLRESQAFKTAKDGTATIETFVGLAAGTSTRRGADGKVNLDPTLLAKTAEDFEKAIWGIQRNTHGATSVMGVSQAELSRLQFNAPKFGTPTGFDLNIEFGSIDPTDADTIQRNAKRSSTGSQVGQPGDPISLSVATSKRILAVEIVGVESVIDDSGRPILEQYNFIARDID